MQSPSCPRCGYDQSGIVGSWTESCPLGGICSECGLTFEWVDVMRPERLIVPGFYEHARGLAPRAARSTLVWTARPRRFWTRIRLEHSVNLRRAVLWLVLLLILLQTLYMASVIGKRAVDNASLGAPGTRPAPAAAMSAWDGAVTECLEPLVRFDRGYWFLRAWGGGATPGGGSTGPLAGLTPVWRTWRTWPLFATGMLCLSIALPGMLLVLPQTRARAKLRLHHVARATVYSGAWLVLLGALRLVDEAWFWLRAAIGDVAPGFAGSAALGRYPMRAFDEVWQLALHHQLAMGTILAAWLGWWWWCALKRGFRVEQSTIVWLAIIVPALLIAITVLTVVSPFGVGNIVDGLLRGRAFPR